MRRADPLPRLKQFVGLLGWNGLRGYRHIVQGSLDPREDGSVVEWFEAGSYEHTFLQINLNPWRAAVYAIRYRLCSGWYDFRLPTSARLAKQEAERLKPFLAAHWFRTSETRKTYRDQHPESRNWTWKRIREKEQPPRHGL